MSSHLPECYLSGPPSMCPMCESLRACEQRSYTLGIEVGKHDGWVAGHAAGVQAARDAVAALEPLLDRSKHEGGYDCCGCATVGYVWIDALDAIDALKESK